MKYNYFLIFIFVLALISVASAAAPVASFTKNSTGGTGVVPIQFNDTSTNTPTAWNWSFQNITGNGTVIWFSVGATNEPVWSFGIGNYSIVLNASNGDGFNISPSNISFVNVSKILFIPVANFSSNVTSGNLNFSVQFYDNSTNTPTSWNWSFGNGYFSELQNPVFIVNGSTGSRTIALTATNADGSNTKTVTNYLTVNNATATASFTVDPPVTGNIPLTIQFHDTSTGSIMSYNWSFGDGSYSTSASPSHIYTVRGTYTVTLTVTNDGGSDSSTYSSINAQSVGNKLQNKMDDIGSLITGGIMLVVVATLVGYLATMLIGRK
jgi:PKD repeat protein